MTATLKWMMAGALCLGAGVGAAQTSKPVEPKPEAATPVEADPQTTSASFGDWIMRCQKIGAGADAQRVCEAAQSIVVQGQTQPIAQIAVGRLKKADPLRITLVLPANVSFPSAPKVTIDGAKDGDAVELGWRRCLPGACFADAALKDDVLKRWRISTGAGKIASKDGAGRDFVLAMSFRGLAQALDALAKEP